MSLKPKTLQENFPQGPGFTIVEAPWRHKYFELPREPGCFICRAIDADPGEDAKNLLLVRGEHGVMMLNRYPYTMGALMVAPMAHVSDYREIDDATLLEMTHLVQRGMTI